MTKPTPFSRRAFLASGLSWTAFSLLKAEESPVAPPPNLLVILADDLGYGDLGCYGCTDIQTPNIDRLAAEGVRMTDAYAAGPVCTPTRCALLTGCYPPREQNLEWAIYPRVQSVGLTPGQPTLSSILHDGGYATGLFGKWHLGHVPQFSPMRHGFEEFAGFLGGNIDYFRHVNRYGDPDWYEQDSPVERDGYSTDLITQHSVDFIQRHTQKPFFLMVSYNAPQGPDDGVVELPGDEFGTCGDRKTYARMVERMDQGIGRILDTLKKANLEENTLVVFLSDNGGDRFSRNEPLRNGKGSLWEGGIRTPVIFRWPVYLPPGRTSTQAIITMDITATMLWASYVKPTRKLDGMNLLPYISGIRPDVEQTFVWRNTGKEEKAVRWGRWKWLQVKGEEYLFDLRADIGEQDNRFQRNIDIVYWLRGIYGQWESAMPHRQTLFGDDLR